MAALVEVVETLIMVDVLSLQSIAKWPRWREGRQTVLPPKTLYYSNWAWCQLWITTAIPPMRLPVVRRRMIYRQRRRRQIIVRTLSYQ